MVSTTDNKEKYEDTIYEGCYELKGEKPTPLGVGWIAHT